FCTIEPNVGIVEVPDKRLNTLAEMVSPEKVIPTAIEFVDIAGLVKGASKGEGLGNKFLGAIREVDAICHVVRHFEDDDITHVEGTTDPKRDREIIEAELIISDLESLVGRMDKLASLARGGDKEKIKELAVYEKILAVLNDGKMAIETDVTEEEDAFLKTAQLLTYKPLIYACNVAENELHTVSVHEVKKEMELGDSDQLITISAKIEEDLQDLSADDAKEFLDELGVTDSGLDRLIHAAYEALGYQTYFTAGVQEVRAWNILKGSTAPQAAGVIHTDFEKGFIKADTIAYKDFVEFGGELGAKEAGKLRQEGKEYIVADGDVMHFKFNV
ncbi:MAG: redox-regulated ATPase YchF, partial [Candidatus Peribacteraceae bacterium]|nr:redox-regulated ATPase YchF [Candidatus Peribacteraceae bacterium]